MKRSFLLVVFFTLIFAFAIDGKTPEGIILSSTRDVNPSFTAPHVSKDTVYTFSLVVNDGFCDSPKSEVLVTVRFLTGIVSHGDIQSIRIDPNPSKGKIVVEFNQKPQDGVLITVLDATGRVVRKVEAINSEELLDMGNYPRGLYFISINDRSQKPAKVMLE